MPPNDIWQGIQSDLSQLHEDGAFASFRPLLEKLQQWASAQPPVYPPEIFRAFIELVRHMVTDVQHGRSIHELLDQVTSGIYVQPEWDVHNVFQAHGHIFQFILNSFRGEIEPTEPDPAIPVPVVLLVMNAAEAQDLASKVALQDYPDQLRVDFEQLQALLAEHGVADWPQRYKGTPEEWQPFGDVDEAHNIRQMVEHALTLVEGCQKRLVPAFVDIRTVNEISNRTRLMQLRYDGCVVVMDAISMRHPTVQRAFHSSMLDAFPSTLVASIAPIQPVWEIVERMVIVIERHIDLEFHRRYHFDLDSKCARVSSGVDFDRWVKEQVPKLLPDEIKSQTGSRQYWYQTSGVRR
jgi:hypothetical protein